MNSVMHTNIDSKVEMRKMGHERFSSQTPVLAENSLNMDTEALEE